MRLTGWPPWTANSPDGLLLDVLIDLSEFRMVVEEGKPVGVITRYDLLGFLSDGPRRK